MLFRFMQDAQIHDDSTSPLRTDGFVLVLEWREGKGDSALLSEPVRALAEAVRSRLGVSGWGLWPSGERYGDKVSFADASVFADSDNAERVASAWGALAAGLLCATSNRHPPFWPFPTLQWDEKGCRIAGVEGLKEKCSVAADCGARVVTVAQEQKRDACDLLEKMRLGPDGARFKRLSVYAVKPTGNLKRLSEDIAYGASNHRRLIRRIVAAITILFCLLLVIPVLGGFWYMDLFDNVMSQYEISNKRLCEIRERRYDFGEFASRFKVIKDDLAKINSRLKMKMLYWGITDELALIKQRLDVLEQDIKGTYTANMSPTSVNPEYSKQLDEIRSVEFETKTNNCSFVAHVGMVGPLIDDLIELKSSTVKYLQNRQYQAANVCIEELSQKRNALDLSLLFLEMVDKKSFYRAIQSEKMLKRLNQLILTEKNSNTLLGEVVNLYQTLKTRIEAIESGIKAEMELLESIEMPSRQWKDVESTAKRIEQCFEVNRAITNYHYEVACEYKRIAQLEQRGFSNIQRIIGDVRHDIRAARARVDQVSKDYKNQCKDLIDLYLSIISSDEDNKANHLVTEISSADAKDIAYQAVIVDSYSLLRYAEEAKGLNVHAVTYSKCKDNMLHLASRYNRIGLVRYILKGGAFISSRNSNGQSALDIAVENGYKDLCSLLIRSGADVNGTDGGKIPPWILCPRNDNYSILDLFLDRKLDINALVKNDEYELSFWHVCLFHRPDLVDKCIDLGADVNQVGLISDDEDGTVVRVTPLWIAASQGSISLMRKLIAHGAKMPDINASTADRGHPLVAAIAKQQYLAVQELLKMGVSPNLRIRWKRKWKRKELIADFTPLVFAIYIGRKDIVSLLLESRADVNATLFMADSRMPILAFACLSGSDMVFNNLGELMGRRVLQSEDLKGRANEILDLILEYNPDLNAIGIHDDVMVTPLCMAIVAKNYEAMKKLIRRGADVNKELYKGQTAINLAINMGDRQAYDILVKAGAKVNEVIDWNDERFQEYVDRFNKAIIKNASKPIAERSENEESVETIRSRFKRYTAAKKKEICGDAVGARMAMRELANEGDAMAQNDYGTYCAKGFGGKSNLIEAVTWYCKSAESGYKKGQYNYGIALQSGLGIPKDEETAAKWIRRAAEQGWGQAQYSLGLLLEAIAKPRLSEVL